MRPTRSLVRQALFNMLGDHVVAAQVLDLYSGSGALGLEALSRGAARVLFVERDRRALAALRENLRRCELPEASWGILPGDARRVELAGLGPFDLVQADPPFALVDALPADLDRPGVLADEAVLAMHLPSARPATAPAGWIERRQRTHGRSTLLICDRAGG